MELERGPDLALARVHLRLGALTLARAELETMAGQDALDDEGMLDLAEARWRTGDLTGAGEAAALVLDDDRGPIVALVVAAEAAAARGRPSEARRLAARALEAAGGSIDATFAGMPRAPIWPADPAAPPPAPTTLFHAAPVVRTPLATSTGATVAVPPHSGALRIWDIPGEPITAEPELPEPEAELDRGRECLTSGDIGAAAAHLAVVLRLGPSLAPVVLDLVMDRTERGLALVRGDAYRLVGRELDARRAFADAVRVDEPPIDVPTPSSDEAEEAEAAPFADDGWHDPDTSQDAWTEPERHEGGSA